jgi:hypothetical protein
MRRAAAADRYLFVFFYGSGDDAQTQRMRDVFENAMDKILDRADRVAIDITDPREAWIVHQFDVSRDPTPLVLSVAPNGAIVRGFSREFDERQLVEAFASPAMEQTLKVLQDRKLVLLCVQNSETRSNQDAMRGAQDFKLDPRFSEQTEIVMLDPANTEEASALRSLEVDPGTDEAVTILLTPPGSAIAKFTGSTDKAMFVAALTTASSSRSPGR